VFFVENFKLNKFMGFGVLKPQYDVLFHAKRVLFPRRAREFFLILGENKYSSRLKLCVCFFSQRQLARFGVRARVYLSLA
jgi:hypothetical protein